MNKLIYIWIIITIFASIPVIASCPLTGACSPVSNNFGFDNQTLENRFIPNNINKFEGSSFNQQNQQQNNSTNNLVPYNGLNNPEDTQNQLPSTRPYNSTCQFGMCLP